MARMVIQVFKVIALSMILVFVLDIAFYLYRAYNLNQRIESVCVSLQKVVSENNYLPEGEYDMFMSIFNQIGHSMNGTADGGVADPSQEFVVFDGANAVEMNYGHNVTGTTLPTITGKKYNKNNGGYQNANLVRDDISVPADYGDIRPIQVRVEIVQPMWDFVGNMSANNWQNSNTNAGIARRTTEFTYMYLVPCLKYQSVTN